MCVCMCSYICMHLCIFQPTCVPTSHPLWNTDMSCGLEYSKCSEYLWNESLCEFIAVPLPTTPPAPHMTQILTKEWLRAQGTAQGRQECNMTQTDLPGSESHSTPLLPVWGTLGQG